MGVKTLLVIELLLIAQGAVCLYLAYKRRNKDLPWISFKNPFNPFKTKKWYKNNLGFYMAIIGIFSLCCSGLFGFAYWININ